MKHNVLNNLGLFVVIGGSARRHSAAFSALDLLVSLIIGLILITMSIAGIAKVRREQSQTICAVNLRGIGIAFRSYIMNGDGRYPHPSPACQWEDLLRPYIHRATFRCPGDHELFPALGSSYNWRHTADPKSSLGGQMFTAVGRANVSLAFDSLPSWHQSKKLQVLTTDGAVGMQREEPFLTELQLPISSGP